MSTVPPRSLPPPQLPPAVVARTRVQALMGELQVARGDAQRGILRYEVGALSEHRLGDAVAARRHYLASLELHPGFGPALIAMQRLYAEAGEEAALDALLQARVDAEPDPRRQAALLCEQAALVADRRAQPGRAEALWRRALALDPECQTAAAMLEAYCAGLGRWGDADTMVALRAGQVHDPALQAALWREVARARAGAGAYGEAVEALRRAVELPVDPARALRDLTRLARARGDVALLAQTLQQRADLLLQGDGATDEAARAQAAAVLLREAGLSLRARGDAAAAGQVLARALGLYPAPVLQLEYLAAGDGDATRAAEVAQALLARGADAASAAGLHLQLARHARQMRDEPGERQALQAAWDSAPDSPVTTAALEDALQAGHLGDALLAHLELRARRSRDAADRELCLLRAGQVAQLELQDGTRALALFERAAAAAEDPRRALREWYGAALVFGDEAAAEGAARRLCELEIDDRERAGLLRDRYVMLRRRIGTGGQLCTLLHEALDSGVCDAWAPDAARIHAPGQADFALLVRAHDRLANQASDTAGLVAHLCAGARACVRAGDEQGALSRLRGALDHAPATGYAVAMMENLLLSRGDAAGAVAMLHDAAAAQASAERSELSLLHAGFVAERAGDAATAARDYEEATDRLPTRVSPMWALMRLGERTGDGALRTRALEGLALWEASLDRGGIHSLELGEHFAGAGQPVLALQPLRAALARMDVGLQAAVALGQLPPTELDDEARALALELLCAASPQDARAGYGELLAATHLELGQPEAAANVLGGLLRDHGSAWSQLLHTQLAGSVAERASSFEGLASQTDAPEARAELLLHALRLHQLDPDCDPGAVRALADAVERVAPGSLPAAMALQEVSAETGDGRPRVAAVRARLAHVAPEQASAQRLAHARALLLIGLPEEAMAEARRLLLRDDDNLALWEIVRAAGYASGDHQAVLEAGDRLALRCGAQQRAQLLLESAHLLLDALGDPAGAERQLRAALEADPGHQGAFDLLHDLLLERGAADELLGLLVLRLQSVLATSERVDLLYEAARLMRALGERGDALVALGELLNLSPGHVGAIGLQVEIHASRRQFREAVECLRRLAVADVPAAQQRLARVGAADFLAHKLADPAGAHAELRALSEAGLGDRSLGLRMIELAEAAGDHAAAAGDCEAAAPLFDGVECADLWRRAAGLHIEHLHDAEAGARCLRAALAALPTDLDACRRLCALEADDAARAELLGTFQAEVAAGLARAPSDAAGLSALAEVAQMRGDGVLLHIARDAERVLSGAAGDDLAQAPWPLLVLDDEDLSALRVPGDGGAPAELARLTASAVAALRKAEGAHGVGSASKRGKPAAEAREALLPLLAALSVPLEQAFVGGDEATRLWPLPNGNPRATFVVGDGARPPFGAAARFAIGRQALALRDGVWPLFFEPPTRWRQLVCAAALSAEVPLEGADDGPELRALARQLTRRMPRAVRAGIAAVAPQVGGLRGMWAYMNAAEMGQLRAGLWLAGTLAPALAHVLGPGVDRGRVEHSERALSLLRFWLSPGFRGLLSEGGSHE